MKKHDTIGDNNSAINKMNEMIERRKIESFTKRKNEDVSKSSIFLILAFSKGKYNGCLKLLVNEKECEWRF